MAKPKFRAFRFELAICIGAPLVVLLAIAIPGYVHIRSVKSDIRAREVLLDEIPVMERRLLVVSQMLAPYRVKNGGKDKIGELQQQVNKLAEEQGVKVKSVNAEKVAVPDSPSSMDYQVSLAGEGGLVGTIRMMDALDQPVQCLKVASVKLRAKSILPHPVYDAEWLFQYRFIPSKTVEEKAPRGGVAQPFQKLGDAVEAMKGLGKGRGRALDMARLESRMTAVAKEPEPVIPETPVSFRLHGIAEDGRGSLALTDRGVFGVGDSIDGYRVIQVAKDHIIVQSRQGRRELVPLYTNEANP